ncbi:MAG: tetratricopeptide repeat protein, partial [Nitrospira sp.]
MPAVVPPTETPAVAAETSLWYQASTAFSDGRYSAAIHLYERYLTNYPKSRRALEAHWDLGQAYEQMGEVTAAIKEYRTLAGPEGAPLSAQNSYAERAQHRIDALRNQPASPAGARSGHTALYVSFSNLPPMSQVEAWIRQLSAQGISAILMDASLESSFTRPLIPTSPPTSSPLPTLPGGALFATSRGPVLTD